MGYCYRENGPEDVTIQIQFCGVCHSDLHTLKNEWGFTRYPIVPGYISFTYYISCSTDF